MTRLLQSLQTNKQTKKHKVWLRQGSKFKRPNTLGSKPLSQFIGPRTAILLKVSQETRNTGLSGFGGERVDTAQSTYVETNIPKDDLKDGRVPGALTWRDEVSNHRGPWGFFSCIVFYMPRAALVDVEGRV
jgi:hypothetical protein